MQQYSAPPQDKDPQLWHIAQRRASFKYHPGTYLVINAFFWILWYFTDEPRTHRGWPWPVWPMLAGASDYFSITPELMYIPKAIQWKENMKN